VYPFAKTLESVTKASLLGLMLACAGLAVAVVIVVEAVGAWVDGKPLSKVIQRQLELNVPFPVDVDRGWHYGDRRVVHVTRVRGAHCRHVSRKDD